MTTINAKVAVGRVGKSAYESAVTNGFVGTEAEWLASLAAYGTPIPTTRDDLDTLALAGGLKPRQQYDIPYQARFWLGDKVEIADGEIEILRLTAISPSELAPQAISLTYPRDYIEYSLSNNVFDGNIFGSGLALTGCVTRRVWSGGLGRQYDTDWDWRALKVRLYLDTETGLYTSRLDTGAGYIDVYSIPLTDRLEIGQGDMAGTADGLAFVGDGITRETGSFIDDGYLVGHKTRTEGATTITNVLSANILAVADLKITLDQEFTPEPFAAGTILYLRQEHNTGQLTHRTRHDNESGFCNWPWVAWRSGFYKCSYRNGNDIILHSSNVEDLNWDSCGPINIDGTVEMLSSRPRAEFRCTGNVSNVRVDQSVDAYGSLTDCHILPTYPFGQPINGDQTGVVFGAESLGPELVTSTRFDQPESAENWPAAVFDGGLMVFDGTSKLVKEAAPIVAVPDGTYDVAVIAPAYYGGSMAVNFGGVTAFTLTGKPGLWRKRIVAETTEGLELDSEDLNGALYLATVRRVGGVETGKKLIGVVDLTNDGANDVLEVLLEDLHGEYVIEARNVTSESGGFQFDFGSTTKPEVCNDPSFDNEPGAELWGYSVAGGFAGGSYSVEIPAETTVGISQAQGDLAIALAYEATYTGTLTLQAGYPADLAVRWRVGGGTWQNLVGLAAGDNVLPPATVPWSDPSIALGVQVEFSSGTGGALSVGQCSVKSIPADSRDGLHYESTSLQTIGEGNIRRPSWSLSNDSASFATTMELYNLGHPTIQPHCRLFMSQFTQGYGGTPYLVHDFHSAAWFGVNADLLRFFDDEGLTHFLSGTLHIYKVIR